MRISHSRFATFLLLSAFAFAVIGSAADARDRKRGYRVTAGKVFKKRIRHHRSDRHSRRYNHRVRGHRYRGLREIAGRDFRRRGRELIILSSQSADEAVREPIEIVPLRPQAQILKVTEHQKELGRRRAELRGHIDRNAEPLTVLTKEPISYLRGTSADTVIEDDFGNTPVVYFND